jgi:hypothetical protein
MPRRTSGHVCPRDYDVHYCSEEAASASGASVAPAHSESAEGTVVEAAHPVPPSQHVGFVITGTVPTTVQAPIHCPTICVSMVTSWRAGLSFEPLVCASYRAPGFGRFAGVDTNPTTELVQALQRDAGALADRGCP